MLLVHPSSQPKNRSTETIFIFQMKLRFRGWDTYPNYGYMAMGWPESILSRMVPVYFPGTLAGYCFPFTLKCPTLDSTFFRCSHCQWVVEKELACRSVTDWLQNQGFLLSQATSLNFKIMKLRRKVCSQYHSFIHAFSKHLWSTCYVTHTVLGDGIKSE